MSLGVNTLMELLQTAAKVLAPAGFDMEIVEKHHNQKLDAPSGTAIALADSMNEALMRHIPTNMTVLRNVRNVTNMRSHSGGPAAIISSVNMK